MKRVIAAGIITVVCLIITIVMYLMSIPSDAPYQTVQVTVVKTELPEGTGEPKVLVYVSYQGKEYILQGATVKDVRAPGTEIEAYLADREMYVDPKILNPPPPVTGLFRYAVTATMAAGMCTFFFWMMRRNVPGGTE